MSPTGTARTVSTRLFDPKSVAGLPSSGRSLDDVISGVCRELESRGEARCPVCSGTLLAGRGCTGCGTELD